jgi:hypothetical protein
MGLPPHPKGPQENQLCHAREGGNASSSWKSNHLTTWRSNVCYTFHKLDDCLCQPYLMFFMSTLDIWVHQIWDFIILVWNLEHKSIRRDLRSYKFAKLKNNLLNFIFRWKNAKHFTRNPLWIYRRIRSEILLNYYQIGTINA